MKYRKITDVQSTWKEFGWTLPSEDPAIIAKWRHYQTLGVQKEINEGKDSSPFEEAQDTHAV